MKQTTDNDDGSSITVKAGQKKLSRSALKKVAINLAKTASFLCICFASFKFVILFRAATERQNHRLDQEASIVVQYTADGHAAKCWVTHSHNQVMVAGPSASIRMTDWKSYPYFSKSLGADPNTCDVWNWNGKDSKEIE